MPKESSNQSKIEVYDPPMCCSTGVCGPSVDPVLPKFAGDLDWLKEQGVQVERFNMAQQPGAFANNPTVKEALTRDGNDCLPLILANGQIMSRGVYLSRDELAEVAGIEASEALSRFSPAVAELVAIGAAIASNCEPCFKYHYAKAKRLGVSRQDVAKAVAMAKAVKEAPSKAVLELADRYLGITASPLDAGAPSEGACCDGSSPSAGGSKCC